MDILSASTDAYLAGYEDGKAAQCSFEGRPLARPADAPDRGGDQFLDEEKLNRLLDNWGKREDRSALLEALVRVDDAISALGHLRSDLFDDLVDTDQETLNIKYEWCDRCKSQISGGESQ